MIFNTESMDLKCAVKNLLLPTFYHYIPRTLVTNFHTKKDGRENFVRIQLIIANLENIPPD